MTAEENEGTGSHDVPSADHQSPPAPPRTKPSPVATACDRPVPGGGATCLARFAFDGRAPTKSTPIPSVREGVTTAW